MPKVFANGIDITYRVGGEGPRALFISGSGGDLRNGLGQTTKPEGDYTMADYAADADALLESLAWPAVPVVGVSFGGMVAQELAIQFPSRVRALVLACTSSGGRGGASYPLHELRDLDRDDRLVRQLVLADVRRDIRNACNDFWSRPATLSVANAISEVPRVNLRRVPSMIRGNVCRESKCRYSW